MTNAALQALITLYGNRIYCINLDNSRNIYIGYQSSVKLTDIELVTIGGTDFIVVHQHDPNPSKTITYKNHHLTEGVQWVGVMDEEYAGYGADPLTTR